jgi:hypothetical protein
MHLNYVDISLFLGSYKNRTEIGKRILRLFAGLGRYTWLERLGTADENTSPHCTVKYKEKSAWGGIMSALSPSCLWFIWM